VYGAGQVAGDTAVLTDGDWVGADCPTEKLKRNAAAVVTAIAIRLIIVLVLYALRAFLVCRALAISTEHPEQPAA